MATRKQKLTEKAEALGIEVRARWSADDIERAIDEQGEPKQTTCYRNLWRGRLNMCGVMVEPGCDYRITGQETETDMKKINRAVEIGLAKRI